MAGEIKQFKDSNNNTHKVDITGVEGLQTALDGKLSSVVSVLEPQSQTIDIHSLSIGSLYLILNSEDEALNTIIGGAGEHEQIHYHLQSGSLTNNYFMIRVFKWIYTEGEDDETHYLIEVVGAWN